jgi:hypothetical protein
VVPPVLASPDVPVVSCADAYPILLLFLLLSMTLKVMLDSVFSAVAAAPSAVNVRCAIGISKKFDVPAVVDIHAFVGDPAVVVSLLYQVHLLLTFSMLLLYFMWLHYFVELV